MIKSETDNYVDRNIAKFNPVDINRQIMCKIIADGFRFMPLGLVRLRTFRLSAWVT